jgi:hypothetical protein
MPHSPMKTRTPGSPVARAMVRKEIWGHLLLYNLIRGVMAEAAGRHGLLPRESSLKGARQTVAGFRADRETIRVLGEHREVAAKLARQA